MVSVEIVVCGPAELGKCAEDTVKGETTFASLEVIYEQEANENSI